MKILIVEDNRSLLKLLTLKIKKTLGLEIDTAKTLKEAKELVAHNKYFLALLDINLPDAPDGEIVDFMLEHKVPSIVLSGNADKAFRQTILKKEIIDYVVKQSMDDIDFIIEIIDRLIKNAKHKVLIVDDSMVTRNIMKKLLKNLNFQVFAAAHGEEAVNILKDNKDIKITLTDYNMPVMNGLELTKEIRKEFSKNEMSIFAISKSDQEDIVATFLKSGATDFIHKPFSKEEFSCRIHNAIEALENISLITNSARRDYLTGIYNRRYFFELATEYIKQEEKFAIAMIDIDNFKKINDTYGHHVGDDVIVSLSNILTSYTNANDIVARFGGEEFCIIFKNVDEDRAMDVCEKIRQQVENFVIMVDGNSIRYTISTGVSCDYTNELNEIINEADGVLYKAKNSGKNCTILA